jgi:hypothetical protein
MLFIEKMDLITKKKNDCNTSTNMSRKVGNSKFFSQILVFALVEPILAQKKSDSSVSTAD